MVPGRRIAAIAAALALSIAASATAATSPLARYVVSGSEETGFVTSAKPVAYTSAKSWGAALGSTKDASSRLAQEGFLGALEQQTSYRANASNGAGVSWVVELGSNSAANTELAIDYKALAVGGDGASVTKRYSLAGLAGSRAWVDTAPGFFAANAILREGRCVLLIGAERTQGGTLANVMSPVAAAAQAVTKSTHGSCP